MTRPDETEQNDEAIASYRESREYALGTLDVEHGDIYSWSGLIDNPRVRAALAFAKEQYDPNEKGMPTRFEETDFFRVAIQKYATESHSQAIRTGNVSKTTYLSGLPGYDSDVSGLHAINQLAEWLVSSEQCKLIYLAALMGRGKTDFALLMLEVIADHYRRVRLHDPAAAPKPEFATNFYTEPAGDDVDHVEVHRYSELLEWAEGGSSAEERWLIFDEASTELTAQSGANAQDVAELFAPFTKKMRKLGINMIVIGHDRQDVHPAIRSIASFIDKTARERAEIYEGIRSREPYGHRLSISGIPPTSWEFDTDDVATWEWDAEVVDDLDVEAEDDTIGEDEWLEWRNTRMKAIYDSTELSWGDVGPAFGLSAEGARKAAGDVEVDVETVPNRPEAMAD